MPTIPTLDGRPTPRPSGGLARYQVPQSRAGEIQSGTGEVIASAARGLGIAADELHRSIQIETERNDRVAAEAAFTKLREKQLELVEGDDGFRSKRGAAAVEGNLWQSYGSRFALAGKRISEGLATDSQRAEFKQRYDVARLQFSEDLLRHVEREADEFARQTTLGVIKVETEQAVTPWRDPAAVALSIERIGAAIDAQADRDGWPAEQRVAAYHQATTALHGAAIEKLAATESAAAATAYLGEYREQISDTAIAGIEKTIAAARVREERRAHEASVGMLSDLTIAVARGQAGYSAIEQAYQGGQGWLDAGDRTRLTLAVDGRMAEEGDQARRAEYLDHVLSGLRVPDPHSKDLRRAVDEAWTARPDPDALLPLVEATGVLPSAVEGVLAGANRSARPKVVAQAASLYGKLREIAPVALEDLADKDRAVLAGVDDMTRAGVDPKEAVTIAREAQRLSDTERAGFDTRYRAESSEGKSSPETRLGKLMDASDDFDLALFSGAPTADPRLAGEYAELERRYFNLTGGNLKLAGSLAFERIRAVWGTSSALEGLTSGPWGKPRVMRHPPELAYHAAPKVLRRDFERFANAEGLDPRRTLYLADAITEREPPNRRTYALFTIGKDDLPRLALGPDNLPLRWRPDPGRIEHDDLDERVKRAAKLREALQEREAGLAERAGRLHGGEDALRAAQEAVRSGQGLP